jgi:hypothetical protein
MHFLIAQYSNFSVQSLERRPILYYDPMKSGNSKPVVGPRLITREQAAVYCGVSLPTLLRICPVKPIALGSNKRLERYDVQRLDEWIETLDQKNALCAKDWLAALDENNDSRSRKGN